MLNAGKRNVIGILIDVVDYEGALDCIFRAAKEKRAFRRLGLGRARSDDRCA